jgi:predicted permease
VCANIANLMLVKGLARRQQTSISLAVGASRSRLMRQALTESVVLGLIGGAAGLAMAFGGTQALLAAVFTGSSQIPVSVRPDPAVLLFALVVSLFTSLVFGMAPAWAAYRSDPVDALRGSGRSTAQAASTGQRTLIVLQAALSLVLLAASGLLTLSLRNLANQQFGYTANGRIAVRIDPNLAGYKLNQLEPLYRTIKDRLSRLPGVLSASYALYSPMSGSNWTTQAIIDGQPPPATDGLNVAAWNRVGPDYFETIGTRIIRGRTITDADTETTRHVAVVNEEFVRVFLQGRDPIGQHFGTGSVKYSRNFEIVGVSENAKYRQPEEPVPPMYFLPRSQTTDYDVPGIQAFENRSLYANDIVLRIAGRNDSIGAQIQRAFAEIDPNLTVVRVRSFESQLDVNITQPALIAHLTSLFGLTALVLASIGLYGVTSYSVQRRTKEIGIRVALGARPMSITGGVLASAYLPIAIGLVLGIPLSLAMGRLLASKLYGVSGSSPVILAGAIGMLAVFALAAAIAPARRAASINPIETLRSD